MTADIDEITISASVSDLALIALEHGLADRRDDPVFAPFVLLESGGHCYVRHCLGENAVHDAAAFLSREPETTSAYALAYDGTVTVEGTEFSAILVIAGEHGAGDAYVFTQRYDASAVTLIGDPALIGQHAPLDKVP